METETSPRKNPALYLALIVALVSIPYLAGLNGEFVYDDHGQIVENPFLQNPAHVVDTLTLRTISDTTIINGRRPVVLLTYFLDRLIWKDHAAGYHATNLTLHLIACLLLYLLIRRIMRAHAPDSATDLVALCAAIVFGLHPVLIEPVHVPAFRPDILCALFTFAYLLSALSVQDLKKPVAMTGMAALSASLFFLALLSKESAIAAPLFAAWIWISLPSTRPGWPRAVTMVLPPLILSTLFMLAWRSSGSFQGATGEWNGLSLQSPDNFLTMPWLWVRYLGLLIWPIPLCIDRIVAPITSWLDPRFIGGTVILIGFAASALFLLRKRSLVSMGMGLMLLAFAPVSNLVPLFNPLADRYAYMVVPGFALLIARGLVHGGFRDRKYSSQRKAALGIILSAYVALGLLNVRFFANDFTLWTHVRSVEPRSARAHTWLGMELKSQGRIAEALELYAAAAKLNPRDVAPLVNMAIVFGEMGQVDQATEILRQAITTRAGSASAHWNLSVALQKQGQFEEALTEAERTVEIDPSHGAALRALVILHIDRKDFEGARKAVDGMLEINPRDGDALDALKYLDSL